MNLNELMRDKQKGTVSRIIGQLGGVSGSVILYDYRTGKSYTFDVSEEWASEQRSENDYIRNSVIFQSKEIDDVSDAVRGFELSRYIKNEVAKEITMYVVTEEHLAAHRAGRLLNIKANEDSPLVIEIDGAYYTLKFDKYVRDNVIYDLDYYGEVPVDCSRYVGDYIDSYSQY